MMFFTVIVRKPSSTKYRSPYTGENAVLAGETYDKELAAADGSVVEYWRFSGRGTAVRLKIFDGVLNAKQKEHAAAKAAAAAEEEEKAKEQEEAKRLEKIEEAKELLRSEGVELVETEVETEVEPADLDLVEE